MSEGGDIRCPDKGQRMSKRLAGKAFKRVSLELRCSFVRHVNLLLRKGEEIVAINLLMQKRVGPSMMYNHELLCPKHAIYAY